MLKKIFLILPILALLILTGCSTLTNLDLDDFLQDVYDIEVDQSILDEFKTESCLVPTAKAAVTKDSVINVHMEWLYPGDGPIVKGYKIYRGNSLTNFTTFVDVPAEDLNMYVYTVKTTDTLPLCFGISAYNEFGESEITTTTTTGEIPCIGESPVAPVNFIFTVRIEG